MKLHPLALLATAATIGWMAHVTPASANPSFDPPGGQSGSQSGQSGTQSGTGSQNSGDKDKNKKDKKSDADFLRDYRKAYAMIHQQEDYSSGIAAMRALGEDDHSDVATEIGFAYRKLGDYDASKVWYERALVSNPSNTRTLEYYGLWQLEQGNRLKAIDHLQRIRLICGNESCGDYRDLKAAIDSGKFSY